MPKFKYLQLRVPPPACISVPLTAMNNNFNNSDVNVCIGAAVWTAVRGKLLD